MSEKPKPVPEKRHDCDYCGRPFQLLNKLARHVRSVHTNERPYVCEFCRKGFARKDKLNDHYKTHLRRRQFICGFCQMAFCQAIHVRRHFDQVHGIKLPNNFKDTDKNPKNTTKDYITQDVYVELNPVTSQIEQRTLTKNCSPCSTSASTSITIPTEPVSSIKIESLENEAPSTTASCSKISTAHLQENQLLNRMVSTLFQSDSFDQPSKTIAATTTTSAMLGNHVSTFDYENQPPMYPWQPPPALANVESAFLQPASSYIPNCPVPQYDNCFPDQALPCDMPDPLTGHPVVPMRR